MNLTIRNTNVRTAAGHQYIDLDLSVNWALCNMGACNYNDYGDFFAIAPHTKQQQIGRNRSIDDPIGWGRGWRLPTKQEFDELLTSCYMFWGPHADTWGWTIIRHNRHGSFLFLPAGGYKDPDGNVCSRERACYWTSSGYEYDPAFAWSYEIEAQYKLCVSNNLHYGFFIRPVLMREYEHLYI